MKNPKKLFAMLICSSILFPRVLPAADIQPAPDDESDWTTDLIQPPKPGEPSPAPTTPEGGFSDSERIRQTEAMRNHVLDQICRNAQIPIGKGLPLSDWGGVNVKGERRLRVMPDNRIAIQDIEQVSFDAGKLAVDRQAGAAFSGLWLGMHFDGASQVLRPKKTTDSCSEIKDLLRLTDFKNVVPFRAELLKTMEVGELWRFPTNLTIGYTATAGGARGSDDPERLNPVPGPTPLNPFSVPASAFITVASFGIGQSGAAMVTVYRMSQDKIRFRMRISHARSYRLGGGIYAVHPAIAFFANSAALLTRQFGHELSHLVAQYLSENVGIYFTSTKGQQLMMEFILDPDNPQDMDELAAVLHGDALTLLKMASRMVGLQAIKASTADRDFRAEKLHEEEMLKRKAAFSGLDISKTDTRTLHLMFPFLFDYKRDSTLGDDRDINLGDQGGEVRFFRSDKNSSAGIGDIPVMGFLGKHNRLLSAQAFTIKDKEGATSQPQAVFIQQEGFLRRPSDEVRGIVTGINEIMSLIGAKGGAPNPRTSLDVDKILPPEPAKEIPHEHGQVNKIYPDYHDGSVAFTLVFNEKAVASIAGAAGETVLRSFTNTLTDRADKEIMNWIVDHGTRKGNRLEIDQGAIKKQFDADDNTIQWIVVLCSRATDVLTDVAAVRAAKDPDARAQAVVKLMSGRGESDLAYGDMLKVLVQLVDPQDVTADLVMNINKGIKDDPNVKTHMLMKKGRPENPGLKAAGEMKNRFAQPTDLVD